MTDVLFQKRLERKMSAWRMAREGCDVMMTWEYIIKPGIKNLARERQRELRMRKKGG